MNKFHVSANLVKYRARARYFYTNDGEKVLHSVQRFSSPVFKKEGWEECGKDVEKSTSCKEKKKTVSKDLIEKSKRRAQKEVFELALCNPELDTFFTLTFAPSDDYDRKDYKEVYAYVKRWFSNRVQRRNMKYILTAERHKKGGIHFHGLCNSSALRLVESVNPHTKKPIFDRGRIVYNIADWSDIGFSTAKIIESDSVSRLKVSKYITKYITKDGKIGGRYFFHGGDLRRWEYAYGEEYEDFTDAAPVGWWCKEGDGFGYAEYEFV